MIYIADLSKTVDATSEEKTFFNSPYTDSSARQPERLPPLCIGGSVSLATIVRGSIDKDALALAKARGKVMNFRDNQKIILAQTVGWLKE